MKYSLPETPLISVLCSSFNHERFVGFFIESLLNQTYSNWELIIIDDCSTDKNVEVIKQYEDSRIKFFKMDFNSGSSIVTTKAFDISKGDIIVDCASDDGFKSNYFETIVKIFSEQSDVGAINNSLDIIDEYNVHYSYWLKTNRNRFELLSEFFYNQNVLYSPGFAVRREEYEKLVPMNFAFIQHQDYKWHLQLLLNTEYITLEEPLVYYRVQRKESKSLGTLSKSALNRYNLEEDYLMDTFLSVKDTSLIERIINNDEFKDIEVQEIPFVLGCSIMKSNNPVKRQWGYRTLLKYFENSENFIFINNKYGFEFKDFLQLSNNDYGFKLEKLKKSTLFIIKKIIKAFLRFLHLYK